MTVYDATSALPVLEDIKHINVPRKLVPNWPLGYSQLVASKTL